MNGYEHYREAERLLSLADQTYHDEHGNPTPQREDYTSDTDYEQALETWQALSDQGIREATMLAAMAQAHATLAQALGITEEADVLRGEPS